MRTVGIVVGLLALIAAAVLAIAAVLSVSNETSWTDLEPGDCFDLAALVADADDDLADVTSIDTIPCSEPHDAEVAAVGDANPDGDRDYPDDATLFEELDRRCAALVPSDLDPARFAVFPIAPDRATWEGRDGRFACVIVAVGGGTVTGSALA